MQGFEFKLLCILAKQKAQVSIGTSLGVTVPTALWAVEHRTNVGGHAFLDNVILHGNLLFMIPMMRPRRATLLGSRGDRRGDVFAVLFDRHDHRGDVEDITVIELTVNSFIVKVFIGTITPTVTVGMSVLISPLESSVAIRADAQDMLTAITIQDDFDGNSNAGD